MRHAAIGMALVRANGTFLEVNDALCRLLGRDACSLQRMRLADVTHPDDLAESLRLVGEVIRGERDAFQREKRYIHADGHLIWGQVSVACLRDEPEPLFVVQIVDISTIKQQQQVLAERHEQLERALQTDPLTGLPSRHVVLEELTRQGGGALLSVGVDRLSEVNHALTHRAGDQLIQAVAARLMEAMGGVRTIARGTGDTFIVHAANLSSPEEAGTLAERLRTACKGPIQFEGTTIPITVSVGVSLWSPGLGGEELLRDAVIAMRQAAANGRDRSAFADAEVANQARQSLELQEQLRAAIANGELRVWLMPLVEMATGTLQGYEALVRWHRADGRIEQPDTFLPVARKAQLAAAIDLLILGQALEALGSLPPGLSVAVNLTPSTLSEPSLVEQVRAALQRHGHPPERLHLEITETALLDRSAAVDDVIRELADWGVCWMVDDFGTGYSSISNLRDLPIHGLKLDRSFTEGIRRGDQKSLRLAQALAGLGEGLGLLTVAEGIEQPEEAAALQALGWQLGQGYYYGAPAPVNHWRSRPILHQPPRSAPPSPASRSNWALAVTDNVPVGLFALRAFPERPLEVLFVSRRSLTLLQLKREQIEADSAVVLSRLHPDDRDGFIEQWRRCSEAKATFRWEGRLEIHGAARWLLVEAIPTGQVDGGLIWQGVISDITEQKQQELHLRRILMEAPIPIAIQELQGNPPRIIFTNRQFNACFGYSTTDIPNLAIWFERAYPNPEERAAVMESWGQSVEQAKASNGVVVYGREVTVTTANGDRRQALFSAVVVGQELVISAVDLTPWRRAEQELAAAKSALAEAALAITEAIPMGTYTMVQPPDGGIGQFAFMSNRFLEICGLNRAEAAADPFKAFACVHPDDYEHWVELNAQAFAHKTPFRGECRVVANGQVRWIVAESVPRSLHDGSTVWEGALTDITQQKQALQQVKQERALLETILNNIDAHVYMKDRQGRFLYANPPLQRLMQCDASGIPGKTDADFMPLAMAEQFRAFDQEVLRSGGPLTKEELFTDALGNERVFLSTKLIHSNPDGDDCLIGFSTEITELRQATEELAASEEHYRLLAENVSDVVILVSSDGRIAWASPSLTPTLGWTPEEWVGQVGTIFLAHGGKAEHYQRNLKILQNGEVPPLAREQIYAKDGSTHWVETHASPYRNAQGEVEGIVASFRVIDSIVAAEAELRLNEERYRLLAENARDVIWTMEPDGRISYVSPSIELLRGFTPSEALQQPLDEIHPPESRAKSQAYFEQLLSDIAAKRDVQSFRDELEYYCRDGSTIWAEVIALPRLDAAGRLIKLLGVSRDITERKKFEQQLTAANNKLEALATTDSLTGISNRRHLEVMIHDAMDRGDRYGEALSLILCDIDFFKAINDNHGHQLGDQVLIEFTQRVKQHLRRCDGFGRWGGEEFIVLLPNSDQGAALAVAEQLRQLIATTPFAVVGQVTASFGVAERQHHEPEASWLRRVDECLYRAKESGRNAIAGAAQLR